MDGLTNRPTVLKKGGSLPIIFEASLGVMNLGESSTNKNHNAENLSSF